MPDQALVYIIDDNEDIRLSLDSLFRSVGLETRMFGSATDFLDADRPEIASCLVLDVRLPGVSGLDFQDQLVRKGSPVPIIVMTGHGDIQMSVRAMKAGAVDFLVKPFRDQDMLDAVSAALQADRDRRQQEGDFASLRQRYQDLTDREKQVMTLVTSGLMNKQVAGELNLSEVTIKIHRSSAMRKMEAKTLADFVRMADLLKRHNGVS
jgi:FixJ family two-component response regulator